MSYLRARRRTESASREAGRHRRPRLYVRLGIETFSHVLVLFFMREASFDPTSDLVRRPRGRADLPEVGIFAQRAKHRPNPIGLAAVRFVGHEGNVLRVRGLDAIDGMPVLDIKPYVPVFDRVDGAVTPPWVDEIMKDYF